MGHSSRQCGPPQTSAKKNKRLGRGGGAHAHATHTVGGAKVGGFSHSKGKQRSTAGSHIGGVVAWGCSSYTRHGRFPGSGVGSFKCSVLGAGTQNAARGGGSALGRRRRRRALLLLRRLLGGRACAPPPARREGDACPVGQSLPLLRWGQRGVESAEWAAGRTRHAAETGGVHVALSPFSRLRRRPTFGQAREHCSSRCLSLAHSWGGQSVSRGTLTRQRARASTQAPPRSLPFVSLFPLHHPLPNREEVHSESTSHAPQRKRRGGRVPSGGRQQSKGFGQGGEGRGGGGGGALKKTQRDVVHAQARAGRITLGHTHSRSMRGAHAHTHHHSRKLPRYGRGAPAGRPKWVGGGGGALPPPAR